MAQGVRPASVWSQLAERASIGSYVPVLRQDLEWARMKTRHGKPNVMLADRPRKYLRLTERDDFLARRMDGTRRVSDLVGWFFFSPLFLVASALITLLRLAAFAAELVKGHDPFAPIAGSGLAGVVVLVVAYYLVIFVHESSHALTCKHFGRMVPKGGFLLYYLW